MNNLTTTQVEGINVIRVTLPHTIEEMEIVPIADVHIGDAHSDEKMFKNVVQYILEKPNRYVVLNGDLMDMALTMSVSDSYGAKYPPSQQIKRVADILRPIKERILAMGSGNHEFRTYKFTGIDTSRYLALELGIEDRYSENSFVLFLKVGESDNTRLSKVKQQVYSIFVQHGAGGGRKIGGKANRLNDSDQIIADADLYIMGHVHTPMAFPTSTFVSDMQNMTIVRKNKFFLLNNAYLDFGGYGLNHGYSPASKQVSYATLYTKGKKRIRLSIGV
jgi:predicted MPP superfamily phosphohydrolase